MADEHKNEEGAVSLSMSLDDWLYLINYLVDRRMEELDVDFPHERLEAIKGRLYEQCEPHRVGRTAKESRPTAHEALRQSHDAGGHVWDDIDDPREHLNEECR